MKFKYFIFLIFPLSFMSCEQPIPDATAVMEADRQFSKMSADLGMQKAFLHFADDSVVMIRPGNKPLQGKVALENQYANSADDTYTLTWEPERGHIANSGELAYTWGFWNLEFKADSIPSQKGTYVSIWKIDHEGHWRFVLDIGNEGLGN